MMFFISVVRQKVHIFNNLSNDRTKVEAQWGKQGHSKSFWFKVESQEEATEANNVEL